MKATPKDPNRKTVPDDAEYLRAKRVVLAWEAAHVAAAVTTAPVADGWIDSAKCAELYGVAFRRVLDAGKRGEIPIHRIGGAKRGRPVVRRSDLDAWIASRRIDLKAAPAAAEESADDIYLKLVGGSR